MYFLSDTANFEKKQINVKQYVRKGKIVRASKRNINKRKKIQKAAIIGAASIAGVLGIGVGTYLGLRTRYIHNLNKFAKNLKANPELGNVLDSKVKSITFTMGGFVGTGGTLKASRNISVQLKRNLSKQQRITNSFVPIEHNFTPSYKYKDLEGTKRKAFEFIRNSFNKLGNNFAKGYNQEAHNIAELVYSYHVKNPTKSINLVGHSGGAFLADEVNYILQRKGIDSKLITMASPNYLKLPSKNKLDFLTNKDFVKPFRSKNTVIIPSPSEGDAHRQPAYFANKELINKSIKHLFTK